jgi:hypothetical protein
MKTAAENLAEAERLGALGHKCPDPHLRVEIGRTADGWRRTALLARQQEAWAEAHPDQLSFIISSPGQA